MIRFFVIVLLFLSSYILLGNPPSCVNSYYALSNPHGYATTYNELSLSPACVNRNSAFIPGEEIRYTLYYNWGFIWVNAGEGVFNVDETTFMGSPVYHLDFFGRSHRWYDPVFRVRDRFQSYVEKQTFRPLWHEMDTYEGGHEAWDVYYFDHEKERVLAITEDSKRPRKTDTIDMDQCSYDIVTAAYAARNLDFSSYSVSDTIPFQIMIRDEMHEINPVFLGRDTVKARRGGTYECLKFSVKLVDGFIFREEDDLFIWVTDDENRIPVLIEAEIRVGSIKAVLNSWSNLRHPLSARID